jgi:competence protein ComEC
MSGALLLLLGAEAASLAPRLEASGYRVCLEESDGAMPEGGNGDAHRPDLVVLAALVVGDQGAIEREDWDLFRRTGIAHLVSISGVHVTMLAWLAGSMVAWAWRRSTRLMLWWPAPLAGRPAAWSASESWCKAFAMLV